MAKIKVTLVKSTIGQVASVKGTIAALRGKTVEEIRS